MAIAKTISQIGDQKIEIYIQVNDDFKVQDDTKPVFRGNAGKKVIEAAKDLFGDGLALTRNCAAKVIELSLIHI